MKKSIFFYCLFLLTLLTQARNVQAVSSPIAAGLDKALMAFCLCMIVLACGLLFKLLKFLFKKIQEKDRELFVVPKGKNQKGEE